MQRQVVEPVPEESALCEFECRKQQCTMEEWEHCERRLHAARESIDSEKNVLPSKTKLV